jgi:hypothetical protein
MILRSKIFALIQISFSIALTSVILQSGRAQRDKALVILLLAGSATFSTWTSPCNKSNLNKGKNFGSRNHENYMSFELLTYNSILA